LRILTVQELTKYIKELVEKDYQLANTWVKGEISNFKAASSGHLYFTLKDDCSCLKVVMFRSRSRLVPFRPENGMAVTVRGYVSVYERDGTYQLYAEEMEPDGTGALYLAFEQLKERLQGEGFFDRKHKKKLPLLPRRIGIVTSPTGAAIRDMVEIIRRRWSGREIILVPVLVQGEGAPPAVARGIQLLNQMGGIDLIIVGRGGGSLEDLWPFNEETVARAIHRCPVPVVSAVGHEVDFTIADFVADRRAPTPSAAVELVVPDKAELERRLTRLGVTLAQTLARRRDQARQHLDLMARRLPDVRRNLTDLRFRLDERAEVLVRRARRAVIHQEQHLRLATSRLFLLSPRRALGTPRQRLEQAAARLGQVLCQRLAERRRHLEYCQTHLEQLNPLSILQRGYAVATLLPAETVIRDSALVPPGAEIRVQVAKGKMDCEVKAVSD